MSRWLIPFVGSEAATKNEAAVVVPQSRSMTPPFHHCRTTHGSTERLPPGFDAQVVHARREESNSGPGFGALHEADCSACLPTPRAAPPPRAPPLISAQLDSHLFLSLL